MSSSNKLETPLSDNEEQVIIDYLQSHNDFFMHHPALLASIQIPHNSGASSSLI